jgi:uncharacterized protein YpmS
MRGKWILMMFRFRFASVLLLLAVVTLACNLGSRQTPAPPPPVSTEAVQDLEATLESAVDKIRETGEVHLELDEAQLTSLVAFELQESGDDMIRDPQVYLRDGQIQVFGTVERQNITGTARVALTVDLDDEGRPNLNVVSASLGPFPIPQQIVDNIESELDEAFTRQLNSLAPNTRFDSIVIADGKMTITGHAR